MATLFLLLVLLPACTIALPACSDGTERAEAGAGTLSPKTVTLTMGGKEVVLEIAATDQDRGRGMKYREELGENRGMLFVYPSRRFLSFWMENTWIPLSIAFVRQDGFVTNIEEMRPLLTEKKYKSKEPCRFAIEMNAGWFERHGIGEKEFINLTPEILAINAE